MKTMTSVCVYCGSSTSALAAHLDLADRFGRALAQRSVRLVFGGGSIGLMGACARGVRALDGAVLGVIPSFLTAIEPPFVDCELRVVDTMTERKKILADEADGFVVLPGGIGTLEEAVETLSWRRLDLHAKPLVFLSEDGFWDPFFHMIEHITEANLLPPSFRGCIGRARTIEDAFAQLEQGLPCQ